MAYPSHLSPETAPRTMSDKGLIAGFAGILLLMVILAVVGLGQMHFIQRQLNQIVNNQMVKLELAARMHDAARERTLSLHRLLVTVDPFERDEQWMQFNALGARFAQARTALLDMNLNPEEQAILDRQGALTGKAVPLQNRVVDLITQDRISEAKELLADEALPAQDAVLEVLNQLNDIQQDAAHKSAIEATTIQRRARLLILGLSGMAILVGIAVAVVVIRRVHRSSAEREFLATHDSLTGLPNRALLIDRLEHEITRARRNERRVGVMFLDLDRFKVINDTLGHATGDKLLVRVGEQLHAAVRESDTIARLGGDEFIVVVGDVDSASDIAHIAEKIIAHVNRPIMLEGRELYSGVSIGISLYPQHAEDPLELLKNADTAMYQAKERGRNNYQFYSDTLGAEALRRLNTETSLRRALEREEFRLHYQPIVDLASGSVVGAEALLRWQHPRQGLLPPEKFVSLLEETGLIVAVGDWVLHNACEQASEWSSRLSRQPFRVSVNLSARQFTAHDLFNKVEKMLKDSCFKADAFELEITESLLMHNEELALHTLNQLSEAGIQLAIDDFGTGYSSLSRLKHLPIDRLKIDRSFIQDITTKPDSESIVDAVIAMAQRLKLSVVAEGVETADQLRLLHSHRCLEGQGFLFQRPLPAEKFEPLFSRGFQDLIRRTVYSDTDDIAKQIL